MTNDIKPGQEDMKMDVDRDEHARVTEEVTEVLNEVIDDMPAGFKSEFITQDNDFDAVLDHVKKAIRVAIEGESLEPIEKKFNLFKINDRELRPPFDQAFRETLLELIETDADVKVIKVLVDLSVAACRKELITLSIPVALLSDVFDLLTLQHCEQMFSYVESHVDVWTEEMFFGHSKNTVLRMCNDLLRRLSKSNATIFCGRILLFLAKFFPFSERSGLNIVSEFNLDNVTEFEDTPLGCIGSADALGGDGDTRDSEPAMQVDAPEPLPPAKLDFSLYCRFWSLQDFFRNPNQLYDKARWKDFVVNTNSVIATFQGLKLENIPTLRIMPDESESGESQFFPKYLTSQKLFDLQLYDCNFRRYVLLQFLILYQYLTSAVRFKNQQDLAPEQRAYVVASTDKIQQLLRETPPDGEMFARIVTNILDREEDWSTWKNNGCPELRNVQPTGTNESDVPAWKARRPVGEQIREAEQRGEFYMGECELTKLWNTFPDNLQACRAKDRDFLPSLDGYFEKVIQHTRKKDAPPLALLRDSNFGWRALRLLARRSQHFFVPSTATPMTELHHYLDTMVRRIAADKQTKSESPTVTIDPKEVDAAQAIEADAEGGDDEDDDDMLQPEEAEFQVQNIIPFRVTVLTVTQFHNICSTLRDDWQTLARKLGYKPDEIDYIVSHNSDLAEQAKNLLHLWFEEDDDSTLDNFLYILEGLGLQSTAVEVKHAIAQNKNLTTDTSNCNE